MTDDVSSSETGVAHESPEGEDEPEPFEDGFTQAMLRLIEFPGEDYERHNDRRQEMGLTWAEYIDGQAPEIENTLRRVIREELDNDD